MKKNYLDLSFLIYISLFLIFTIFNPRNLPAEEISSPHWGTCFSDTTAKYIIGSDTTIYPLHCGSVLSLPLGGTITFKVYGYEEAPHFCYLCADVLPEGATFPCVGGVGELVSSIFTWTPSGSLASYAHFHTNVGFDCVVYFDIILPVELSSFSADIFGNNVNLYWQTASEINNSRYEIERSKLINEIIQDWITIGSVNGNGTTSYPSSYTFKDNGLTEGNYKYRLKQLDFNGNFEYYYLTNSIQIGIPSRFELSQNYPNPFNPATVINYNLAMGNKVSLKVYNSSGIEIKTLVEEFKNAGYYSITFDGKDLSSGLYYYKIVSGNFVSVKKMMLLK